MKTTYVASQATCEKAELSEAKKIDSINPSQHEIHFYNK